MPASSFHGRRTIFIEVHHDDPSVCDISHEIMLGLRSYGERDRDGTRLADPQLIMYGPVRYTTYGNRYVCSPGARARTPCMKCLLYAARRPPPRAAGLLARATCRQHQTGTHDQYYSKSRIVMSGPPEVGVIYGHGIPGTYINTELASYEKILRDGNKW